MNRVPDYELRSLELSAALPRYTDWVLADFRPYLRGRVIEVGAGIGTIARRYVEDVDEAVLVEPAANLCAHLTHNLREAANAHVLEGTLHDVFGKTIRGVTVAEGAFDTAILVNVLEHIEKDEDVLRLLHRLLKPGGVLLLFVPAMPFLYGAPDARMGHVRRYTRASLTRVIERAGFAVRSIRYFDLLGMIPWFVTGRLLGRSTMSPGSALFYDRYVVPFCKAFDAAARPRIGKNLVSIARKP